MPYEKDQMLQRATRRGAMDLKRLTSQAARMGAAEPETAHRVPIAQIVRDPAIQVRVGGLDQEKVTSYAIILREGGTFPPVELTREGNTFYMADGFHRCEAHLECGLDAIDAVIKPGGYEAAVELAEEGNLRHGHALSLADKKNIYTRRLARGYWNETTSNREIAQEFGVAHTTIGRWLQEALNQGGANAPLAESHGKAQKALTHHQGTRETNKKRGPTQLQLRQRAVRDLRHAAECLRDLDVPESEQVERFADELAQLWEL